MNAPIENMHKQFQHNYPIDRRGVGWRRGLATFFQAGSKWPWGTVVFLGILGSWGYTDTIGLVREIQNGNLTVIGATIAGTLTTGFLAGAASWRKWACRRDPMEEDRPPRKPRKKKLDAA